MKNLIINILKPLVNLEKKEIENLIEIPPSSEMGDFSFPCFSLSKTLKKNPSQIAEDLKKKIKLPKEIEKLETKGPYLNFFSNKKIFCEKAVKEILKEKTNFGKLNIGKNQKAIIEHTSINPNASPHVGRARNAILGDSITKILCFSGFKPEVHYYVNDVSKQIAMLALANADKLKFQDMLKKYSEISKKVENSKELEKQVFSLLKKFESKDKKTVEKFKKITQTCVKGQEKILSDLEIKYDFFDYESSFMNKTKEILSKLEKTNKLSKDSENRLILNQENTSVEGKMKSPVLVLTRSDQTGLYVLRDIAYTIYKLEKSKNNFIVLGEDQKLYFNQLQEALKLLNYPSPKVIHYSFILLKEKSKTKKMSTRKGDVVLLEDFIKLAKEKAKREISKRKTKGNADAVAVSAVKYSILKNSPNKSILFDLDEALNFEGDTGPYLLYSYARATSILKKSKIKISNKFNISEINKSEAELCKKLFEFKKIVEDSFKNLNPSLIANYSYQLSKNFNEFYHSSPVINSENEKFRIALVESFRIVLKNSLNLLGINVINEM